ncbi:MAG TPA: hypothetical protein VIG55_01135 [Methylosinus sp.]
MSHSSLSALVSTFGKSCKAKLANRAAARAPDEGTTMDLDILIDCLPDNLEP